MPIPNIRSLKRDSALVEIRGSYVPLTELFDYQSYFDSTLLEKAILQQDSSASIVPSTLSSETIPGAYSFALHPDSETPVAVEVGGIDGIGKAATIFLKPGQIVSPLGSYRPFNTFKWGLPFGWLGGGLAQLLVFTSPDAYVLWASSSEVIFQRTRMPIFQPADLTNVANNNSAVNWPGRFPWVNAKSGDKAYPQGGQPLAAIVRPTRTLMTLNPGTLGTLPLVAPASMRLLLQESQAFGLDSAGNPVATSVLFEDVQWPSWTNVGASGNLSVQTPLVETQFIQRLGSDDGGVTCVDNSGAATLANCFVDFVRMGRL